MILLLLELLYLFGYSVNRHIKLKKRDFLFKAKSLKISNNEGACHLLLLLVPLLHYPVRLQIIRAVLQQACVLHHSLLQEAASILNSFLKEAAPILHSLAIQPVLLIVIK